MTSPGRIIPVLIAAMLCTFACFVGAARAESATSTSASATRALATTRPANEEAASASDETMVSVTEQLRLKRRLLMGSQSLAEALREHRRQWDRLAPEDREQMRRRELAFQQADPKTQQQVVRAWEAFSRMTPQEREQYRRRMLWMQAVLDRLTPGQKADLMRLPADQRARELVRLGRSLGIEKPSEPERPGPATQPATQPADPAD